MAEEMKMHETWARCRENGVRWRPGMAALGDLYHGTGTRRYSGPVSQKDGKPVVVTKRVLSKNSATMSFFEGEPLPILTDPATIGAMLGELRRIAKERGFLGQFETLSCQTRTDTGMWELVRSGGKDGVQPFEPQLQVDYEGGLVLAHLDLVAAVR